MRTTEGTVAATEAVDAVIGTTHINPTINSNPSRIKGALDHSHTFRHLRLQDEVVHSITNIKIRSNIKPNLSVEADLSTEADSQIALQGVTTAHKVAFPAFLQHQVHISGLLMARETILRMPSEVTTSMLGGSISMISRFKRYRQSK